MFLTDELDAFIERLKISPLLESTNIIKAYPYVMKPTRLDNVVITVSPAGIDGKSTSIGDENIFAYYTIDADIFVPQELGSPKMGEYIQAVLSSQISSAPCGIAASGVKANDKISCFTVKCSFTYNGELELRED